MQTSKIKSEPQAVDLLHVEKRNLYSLYLHLQAAAITSMSEIDFWSRPFAITSRRCSDVLAAGKDAHSKVIDLPGKSCQRQFRMT